MRRNLKESIAKGKTRETIALLLDITQQMQDDELHESVVLVSARFEKYEREKNRDTSTTEEQNVALAKINGALLEIIQKLPANEGRSLWDSLGIEFNESIASNSRLILFFLGFFILLIVLFVDSPVWSGINSKSKEIRPSESVTVFIHGKEGKNDLALRSKGMVELTYGTKKAWESINEKGQAVFNEIPKQFFNNEKGVYINIREADGEPYRALYPDSLHKLIPGEAVYVPVILSGLDRIFGTVYWDEHPLEDVIVSCGFVRDTSDRTGNFELVIPSTDQKQKQQVQFQKEGFQPIVKNAYPQTRDPLNVIMLK